MAFHVRSNSFPSKSHPTIADVEDLICRLRSPKEASSSYKCTQLASLRDLNDNIHNLIQLPSVQQALADETCASELVDGSLNLVDVCGVARDVILSMKESVQELQSSLRRNKGIDAYLTSRKSVDKMVKRCIKNLNSFEQCSTNKDSVAMVIKESQVIGLSALKSALTIFASKQKTWLLQKESSGDELYALNIKKLSKDINTLPVQDVINQLKESEMTIQELEENLESFFKSLLKIRVSLLNVKSH